MLIFGDSRIDLGEVGVGRFIRPSLAVSLWSCCDDPGDAMDAIEGDVTMTVLMGVLFSSASRNSVLWFSVR